MSEWTVDTLKEYLENRLDGQDERTKVAFQAAQAAVDKAETRTNERLEAHNQIEPKIEKLNIAFRSELTKLMRIDVAEQRFNAMTDADQARFTSLVDSREARFKALEDSLDRRLGAVEKKTDDQDTRLDTATGRFGGYASAFNGLLVLLALALTITAFIIAHT